MTESIAELAARPQPSKTQTRDQDNAPEPDGPRLSSGRIYLILGGIALVIAAVSLLIPSTPSYDPWAWIVWGREIIHLKLHTAGGPSWKPLPVLFTTVFALFGKAAPDLWLVVARTGAVMATFMCFRVAWRLTSRLTGDRDEATGAWGYIRLLAPLLAALIATGSFVNSPNVFVENALGYSEGLMTALFLIAFERHLDGAPRQAFAIGFLAALDRPELWLLLFPYGVWLWRRDPSTRTLVLSLFALIPVLWFLPELWGSGHLFRSIARAQNPRSNSAAFANCPFCTEFDKHAWPSALPRVEIGALVTIALAAFGLWRARAKAWWRSSARGAQTVQAAVVFLGALGFLWWVGVAIETQAGFSGNDRYLVLGTALIGIVAGVGWAWAGLALARLVRRIPRVSTPSSATAGGLVALAAFIAVPPWIGRNVTSIPATHGSLIYQARLRENLTTAVNELGGPAKVRSCGTVMTEGFQVPMVAWTLGVHTIQIEAPPGSLANPGPPPNVIFQTRATRRSSLLPVVQAWKGVHYQLVAQVRFFSVFSHCAGKVAL